MTMKYKRKRFNAITRIDYEQNYNDYDKQRYIKRHKQLALGGWNKQTHINLKIKDTQKKQIKP